MVARSVVAQHEPGPVSGEREELVVINAREHLERQFPAFKKRCTEKTSMGVSLHLRISLSLMPRSCNKYTMM